MASTEATEWEDDGRGSEESFERQDVPSFERQDVPTYSPQEWKRCSVEMDRRTWAKRM